MRLLKEFDLDTFERYQKREDIRREKYFSMHGDLVISLLDRLLNGVRHDDEVRQFDILDYYLEFGVDLEELSYCIEFRKSDIKKSDYLLLRRFISTHKRDESLDIDLTLNTTTEINAKRNSKGYPIPGTGRVIERCEKEDIIMYLNSFNVPITIRTYNIALKRYLDGSSKLEKSNQKVLKK